MFIHAPLGVVVLQYALGLLQLVASVHQFCQVHDHVHVFVELTTSLQVQVVHKFVFGVVAIAFVHQPFQQVQFIT